MYSVIRVFCKAKLPDDAKLRLLYCSLLSLWAVVKAFYTMVFALDTTIGPEGHMQPILNGIENWKIVWNCRLNNGDDDVFDVPLADSVAGTYRSSARSGGKCLGFWRYAAEYWLLARILLMRKASVGSGDRSARNPLSNTNIDLSWVFCSSPFDRYDQNAFPRLVKFLQREQRFENSMNQYSL
ncbi:uncharacterized protein A1O5_11121 [Cladophialophora psammophila CBS 110553]|uniref:Uncharacterized protein n=1 Tax=Cladophialophora psammophila CBS 110553 TaxID=1182543 RepID=W9X559_9EURO|nr:uncharacterized protein A1O5_11121 [Cladophialophora psammophila CBS 110553]EXJ65594.1 hypothetical protein A1O5_11121 [Cladophialophora psammophila CBS 110553]